MAVSQSLPVRSASETINFVLELHKMLRISDLRLQKVPDVLVSTRHLYPAERNELS